MREALQDWLTERISRALTRPLQHYQQHVAHDLGQLKRHLRPADVILVDGEQRVSLVIKYLTQSTWSHIALYVGDEVVRRQPERAAALRARFGDEAEHLLVEALSEGVSLSPISKYANHNIRVCRPTALHKEDRARLLAALLDRVGHTYDLKNIIDLARFFFPVSLLPSRFRRPLSHLGSGAPTAVICTSLIAEGFQDVGYPILPRIEPLAEPPAPRRWRDRWFNRSPEQSKRYFKEPPSLVTPRDFDLSPYFDIVKFSLAEETRFDYRRIPWADRGRATRT